MSGERKLRGAPIWDGAPVESLLVFHDGADYLAIALACYVQAVAARFVCPIGFGVPKHLIGPLRAFGLINEDVDVFPAQPRPLDRAAQIELRNLPQLFSNKGWPPPPEIVELGCAVAVYVIPELPK